MRRRFFAIYKNPEGPDILLSAVRGLRAVGSGSALFFFLSATATPQRFCSWKTISLLRYHLESPQVAE